MQNVLCEIYDIVGHVLVELLFVVGKPPPPPVPRPGPGRSRVQTNVKPPPGFLQRSNFHNKKQCILTSETRPTTTIETNDALETKTRNMIVFGGFSPGAHEPNSLIKIGEIWSVFIASDFHVVCSLPSRK